jgi:hypothetical protein
MLGSGSEAAVGVESRQGGAASGPQQTYEGMITDTHCGAKHDPSIARSATDCVRACVHGGAQFALVFGDRTYILRGDPAVFKRLAGERARVAGTLNGNTITVSSTASEE